MTMTSNTVSASGDVQLNYKGRTLQADKVIYDRNTGRVFASGNARLTEADGTVITGDRFELTDDFKSGFIDSLRLVQQTTDQRGPVTARFSAPRAERAEGETTVFERGTYTACEPCKEHPEKPAALAGEGGQDHPRQQRADDLLRERHPRARRHPGGVHAVFLVAGPDGEAQDRAPRAALHHVEHAWHRRLGAVLLGDRAELRPHGHADLLLPPGAARGRRVAPPSRDRRLQHPRGRHLPGGLQRLSRDPLRRRRARFPRLRRKQPASSTSTSGGAGAGTAPS